MREAEPSEPSELRRKLPKEARYAALAMLALAALTTVGVAAYFASKADPWTWRGLVALATIPFSLGCAALLWRAPSRENAGASLLVIAFSIVRVGTPDEWTNTSWVLIFVTLVVAAPVAWAARTLPQ